MEIQMIGHASIFVKTQDCAVLMDPVLWDPHQQGLCHISPQREVLHDRLPSFDFLIVSHRHQDHFDLRTLASLPKQVEVLIPKDPVIESCLRRLGYERINALDDFSEVKVGSTRICATPSENRVPEFGVLIGDSSGVFWNQVDTVVRASPQLLHFLRSRWSGIDFLLATWQQMLELSYQRHEPLSFPFEDYGRLLDNISLIRPKALAPGANGFKYVGESAWLNHIVFPLTREQFCEDVRRVCPDLEGNIFALDPGDVIEIDGGVSKHHAQQSDFVRTIRDDREELDFQPVRIASDLVDNNREDYPLEVMKRALSTEIESAFPMFVNEREHVFAKHRQWEIIYQVEVVFPDGPQQWFIDFSEEKVRTRKGRTPLANYFVFITASSLYALLERKTEWDYIMLGGFYRRYLKVYSVNPLGIIRPKGNVFADVLELKFPHQPVLRSFLEQETEKWRQFYADSDEKESA